MLKAPLQDLSLFFDLEWVPDAAGAKRLFDLADDVSEFDAMQALWENSPDYKPDTNPRPFLKYMFSRVVSIAFLSRKPVIRDGEPFIEFSLNSLPELPLDPEPQNEAALIERFLYILGKRCPQLIGYNSADSDIQVLIQRGMINEVTAPGFCKRPDKPWEGSDYFRRWDNEDHLDLMKLFSVRGMTPRLDELAKLCGFPGKIDVKGDQVTDLWLAQDLKKIVEYNQIDVLNTYLVWLRIVYFCGKMTEEEYFQEQEQFREFLDAEAQKPEKEFVSEFIDKWPH
jgi:predicted PolB exonuclease-like 3'-5' exonuclease